MGKIGLMKPRYSSVTVTEDEYGNEMEAYGPVKALGRAIHASVSINMAEAKEYSDDGLSQSVKEFTGGQLNFTADDIEDEEEADVTGATIEEGTGDLVDKSTDQPGYKRFGFILRRKKRNKPVQYRAFVLTRVQFSALQEEFETKGESIVFKNTPLAGEIMLNHEKKWRVRSKWTESFAEAEARLNALVSPKSAEATAAEGEA